MDTLCNSIHGIMDFREKVILAPMVRIGALPFRLLALQYGADIVYAEEIVDHKILKCKRQRNTVLGTVDFVHSDGTVVFRTCEGEKGKVVFQMGTADPSRAVQVAKMLEADVAAIDVNMGCPMDYSLKGGMGAALLSQPEMIRKILTALVTASNIPITCKIRILPSLEATLELVKLIESTGVRALCVHARYKEQRSSTPCHVDILRAIAGHVKIPVIANGGSLNISSYSDTERFRLDSGCSSVMVASAAMKNPSVFRKEGPLEINVMIRDYLKLAVDYDAVIGNVKYTIPHMVGIEMEKIQTLRDICQMWSMEGYHDTVVEQRKSSLLLTAGNVNESKQFLINNNVIEITSKYQPTLPLSCYPKTALYNYYVKRGLSTPKFYTEECDKLFKGFAVVEGNTFSCVHKYKNKRSAEQSAALAALQYYKITEQCSIQMV